MPKQRYQVAATYLMDVEYSPYPQYQHPMIMAYYDVDTPDEAFQKFLEEHAPNVQEAQWFYEHIMVVPVPKDGFIYKLSDVYGEVARFPNHKYLEEEGRI